MITKNDCILLLDEIKNKQGIDTQEVLMDLIKNDVSLNTLKFINNNKEFEISKFYEKLRKSYNNKKSNLYINIVKEIEEPKKVLTTLSALLTQILLFADQCEDRQMFLAHSRAVEVANTLKNYFIDNNIIPCVKMLKMIKIDLKIFENIGK